MVRLPGPQAAASAIIHAALGILVTSIVWLPYAPLESARERLLWGFPGPLLFMAPLVIVAGAVPRWHRPLAIADLGIALAAGVALGQDVIRARLAIHPAPELTAADTSALAAILVLSLLGLILLRLPEQLRSVLRRT
jgi:hypothetical protein